MRSLQFLVALEAATAAAMRNSGKFGIRCARALVDLTLDIFLCVSSKTIILINRLYDYDEWMDGLCAGEGECVCVCEPPGLLVCVFVHVIDFIEASKCFFPEASTVSNSKNGYPLRFIRSIFFWVSEYAKPPPTMVVRCSPFQTFKPTAVRFELARLLRFVKFSG